jgi:phosphoribosylformylglycinamidine cyclo-ligase
MAHITGGGLIENLPRVLPAHCCGKISKSSWDVPAIFKLIQEGGNIDEFEMLRTFNCGIGMVLVVPKEETEDILGRLSGLDEKAWLIGEIIQTDGQEQINLTD